MTRHEAETRFGTEVIKQSGQTPYYDYDARVEYFQDWQIRLISALLEADRT